MLAMIPSPVSRTLLIFGLIGVGLTLALSSHMMITTPSELSPSATRSAPLLYLLSAVGACKGSAGYIPCFGGNISQAEVFNCASAAASQAGCTETVASASKSSVSYRITVWFPYVGRSNEPGWANATYESSGEPNQKYFVACISTNSTAFLVAELARPPV